MPSPSGPFAAAAAGLLCMAACNTPPPLASSCPGQDVGTFSLTATLDLDGGALVPDGGPLCNFALDAGFATTHQTSAVLAWDPSDGGATYLCLDQPESMPLSGTHAGGSFTVTSDPADVPLDVCGGCHVTVEEVVNGSVPQTEPTGGTMTDFLSGGTGCATGSDCVLPCQVDYTLTVSFP